EGIGAPALLRARLALRDTNLVEPARRLERARQTLRHDQAGRQSLQARAGGGGAIGLERPVDPTVPNLRGGTESSLIGQPGHPLEDLVEGTTGLGGVLDDSKGAVAAGGDYDHSTHVVEGSCRRPRRWSRGCAAREGQHNESEPGRDGAHHGVRAPIFWHASDEVKT